MSDLSPLRQSGSAPSSIPARLPDRAMLDAARILPLTARLLNERHARSDQLRLAFLPVRGTRGGEGKGLSGAVHLSIGRVAEAIAGQGPFH